MTISTLIINTILPGDACLGMPPASEAGVQSYFVQQGLTALTDDFVHLLQGVSIVKCGQSFLNLDSAARLQAINACKLANVRLFSAFLTQVFRAYYTAPEVLRLIGSGSVPPFPSGNELGQDDWSLLENVFERGQAYREVLC
jgi:hypothetical protein